MNLEEIQADSLSMRLILHMGVITKRKSKPPYWLLQRLSSIYKYRKW